MRASVEISMYPLQPDYKAAIKDFIRVLGQVEGLEVQANGMSTQVFGEYDLLSETIHHTMKTVFERPEAVVMVMKWFNSDRSHTPEL